MEMKSSEFSQGDWVVYRMQKSGSTPGPRASNMVAAEKGETYSYTVDKYWVVQEVLDEQSLLLRTRRGKRHVIDCHDPRLKKANWFQRVAWGGRFRSVEAAINGSSG